MKYASSGCGQVVSKESIQRATIAYMEQRPSTSSTAFDDLFQEDVSRSAEKRSDWAWIYLPFLIGILALAGIGFLLVRAGFGTVSAWADASLVMMILLVLIMAFVPLMLSAGLIYGVVKLIGFLPELFQRLRRIFGQAESAVDRSGDIAVRPLLMVKSFGAALRAISDWLASIVKLFKGGIDG